MASRHPKRYRKLILRLQQARKEAGMTQEDVASSLGTVQKYISRVETGERRIDPIELQELAKLYRKPIEYFLE